MKNYKWRFLILISVLFGCDRPQPISRYNLHEQWEFKQQGTEVWRAANVPGVVHTDLMANNIIPDPWVGTNEIKVQWIENEHWLYKTTFSAPKSILKKEVVELVFDGLDTYANVSLNGKPILLADNMFRSWRVDVKDLLNTGSNELQIKFLSPIQVNNSKLDSLGYELPAPNETVDRKVSPFTRKAPYHFGWDWGLRLVTSGIWRPVYLEAYDAARIVNVQLVQSELNDSLAKLNAVVSIESISVETFELEVLDKRVQVNLKKGLNEINVPFEIASPRRWWPNGWGEQHLYEIPVSLQFNGNELDSKTEKIGLRTVELIREQDNIGESFYFKINGEKLFARGANYIPQSHFLPSVKEEDYIRLVKGARDVGMNMLRVWGGGIYEEDKFYELCDEYGILVWQDFMFACSMYPGDSEFIDNVEEEVIENVKRLRNHPSIVLWNGNNEVDVAWNNWGWQDKFGFSEQDSTQIWQDYLHLFHNRIPAILGQLDDRPYTTTSPLSNWGKPENYNFASMHYWGVWHGPDDFDGYQRNVGRFMSEYGFQSFPDIETIAYFADPSQFHLESEVMKHHQKSYIGNGMIDKQLKKYYEEPSDFEDFVIKSQQTQAKAMQIAIDAHRLRKGHCWGTLFWQLNDCWPGPSWSAIDVFGREKVFYEELPTLYAPVALIPQVDGNDLVISLVNDSLSEIDAIMQLTIHSSTENERNVWQRVKCKKNGVVEVYRESLSRGFDKVDIALKHEETTLFERTFEPLQNKKVYQ